MLRSLLRDEHNQFLVVEDISTISDIVQHKGRLLWLDLDKPTLAEFRMIQEEFGLHTLAIEDAMARHPRPKVDQYDNFYLVVFYLATVGNTPEKWGIGNDPDMNLHKDVVGGGDSGVSGGAGGSGESRYGTNASSYLGPGTGDGGNIDGLSQMVQSGHIPAQQAQVQVGHAAGLSHAGQQASNGAQKNMPPRPDAQRNTQKRTQADPARRQDEGRPAPWRPFGKAQALIDNSADSPHTGPSSDRISLRELTMFMGENYLITVHHSDVPEFAEVARRWRQNVGIIRQPSTPGAPAQTVPGCRHLTEVERANLDTHMVGMAPDVPREHTPNSASTPVTSDRPQAGAAATVIGDVEVGDNPPTTNRVHSMTNSGPAGAAGNGSKEHSNAAYYRRPRNGQARHGKQSGEIGILLYSMLDTIVDAYFPVVDSVVDRVEDLEEEVFERYNQAAIESIFTLKKDLLALRKVLAPERDVLNVLVRRDLPLFDEQTLLYFQDLYDHVVRITDSIDTYRDLLSSALDSFLSMQSNRLNITVQALTSWSIILMSIAAVTGWYGMNWHYMPELESPYGYPITIAFVTIVIVIEFFFFRRKKWL